MRMEGPTAADWQRECRIAEEQLRIANVAIATLRAENERLREGQAEAYNQGRTDEANAALQSEPPPGSRAVDYLGALTDRPCPTSGKAVSRAALRAENERLKDECDKLQADWRALWAENERLDRKVQADDAVIDGLELENKRLREALEKIAGTGNHKHWDAVEIARAALQSKGETPLTGRIVNRLDKTLTDRERQGFADPWEKQE